MPPASARAAHAASRVLAGTLRNRRQYKPFSPTKVNELTSTNLRQRRFETSFSKEVTENCRLGDSDGRIKASAGRLAACLAGP
jgi:hypothetical protein